MKLIPISSSVLFLWLLLMSGSEQTYIRASVVKPRRVQVSKLGPGKQTFQIDTTRQLVVSSVATLSDSPLLNRAYTLRLSQNGKAGKSEVWESYQPPRIWLLRGSDGQSYLLAEINQQASEIVLYRLRGRNLQEIWSDASKQGFTVKVHANATAEIRMNRFGFQVDGPWDKSVPKYAQEIFQFRNGSVKRTKVVAKP
jgi:hypothetical protein